MNRYRLPEKFTRIGFDEEGREYIQCTRTGDVLVQTGPNEWSHFADGDEWRTKTAARLYPEMIFLQKALKRVGAHEEIEAQIGEMRGALAHLEALRRNVEARLQRLEHEAGKVALA